MCTVSLGVNKTAEKKVPEVFLTLQKSCDQNGPLQMENTPFNSSPLNYKAQYESANPDPLMALSLQDIVTIQIAIRRDNTVDLLRLG